MGVIVKGIKMPMNCKHCPFISTICYITNKDNLNVRQDDCPLVEIPDKHGRLIDADDCFNYMITNNPPAWEMLKYAPTVIDADGRNEYGEKYLS